jgi:hypothetical protein
MLRSGVLFVLAMTMIGAASGADQTVIRRARHPHYQYKTVITDPVVVAHGPAYVYRDPDLLFTPLPYVPPLIRAPLPPGSTALLGYYGPPNPYDYPGPYDGGPEIIYWDRLPYACGVYGYC